MATELITEQKEALLRYLADFKAHGNVTDASGSRPYADFDRDRVAGATEITALAEDFMSGRVQMQEFKEKSSRLSIKHNFWGFTGWSGQMQLNMYANAFGSDSEATLRLGNALALPKDMADARQKINDLAAYIRTAREVASNPRSLPRDNQAFLLSYFWEMQATEKYPVYYKSSRDTLSRLGFNLESHETSGDEFDAFAQAMQSVQDLFTASGEKMEHPVWFVEHVLWYGGRQNVPAEVAEEAPRTRKQITKAASFAPTSWLPMIIADVPSLARNEDTEWSKERGVNAAKAFETKLAYVFTLLGHEVEELGQGTGIEPDGIATSVHCDNGDYALVYDAKATGGTYNIGTEYRKFIDVIQRKKTTLRRGHIAKMYFLLIAPEFADTQGMEEAISNIRLGTQVSVILLTAADLLYIVEEKLKNVAIDHTLMEKLFLDSGLLTRERIVGVLGA